MKIVKFLYTLIQVLSSFVEVIGVLFVLLLATYSIVLLKTGSLGAANFDFGKLITDSNMAWLYIIILCSYVVDMLVKLTISIKNGVKVVRKGDIKSPITKIISWFVK